MKFLLLLLFLSYSLSFSSNEIGRVTNPYNAEFVELEIGPSDVLWVGTWGDGIKKSSDQAVTWANSSTGLTALYINDIHYSHGILLAGTQDGGVFKSTNEGNTWVQINSGLTNLKVKGVAVKDATTYFASTQGNGIFRTTDGGQTWEAKNNGNNFQDMTFVHITPAGNVLACRNGEGLIRSDDNGESWQYSQSGIFSKYLLDIKTLPNDEIWISSAGEGIFQSSDDGMHWLRVERLKNIVDLNIESFTYFEHENEYFSIVGTRNWGIWRFDTQWNDPRFLQTTFQWRTAHSIQTLSTGRIVVAVGSDGVSYTDNDGSSWKMYAPYVEDDFKGYKLEASGNNVYAALDNKGVFKSSDYGVTWNSMGLVQESYGKIKKFGNRLYVVSNEAVKYTDDDGVSWKTLTITDLETTYWPDSTEKIYNYKDIYQKNNNIWVAYTFYYKYNATGTPPNPPSPNWTPPAPKNKVFFSSNNGTTWILQEDIDNNSVGLENITATTDNDLYISSQKGVIWKSSNNGTNWIKTAKSVENTGAVVEYLKPYYNNLFVGLDDSLMVTNNDGNTFTKVDWGAENIAAFLGYDIYQKVTGVGVVDNKTYYVGLTNSFGIYKTTDNGVSFDSINNSFPCEEIKSVANNDDGDVYFATTGIWRVMNPKKMPAPLLVSPPDKTGNLSVSPTSSGGRATAVITWEEAEKADMYEIQVSEYEQFYNYMYKKVHAGTSATLTDSLKYNTTYYWRVRSKTNDSYSRWSTRWEFTTELPAPTLTYPANNDYGVPLKPTYQWDEIPNSLYYVVQLSSSTAFSDVIFSSTVTSTTFSSGTYTPENVLTPSTTYYWRAKAVSNKSESNWSDYNIFTTVTGKPTLIYPANNSTEIPTASTFKFKGVPSGTKYFIQISSDSTFQNLALLILNRETETDSTHFFDFLQYYKKYHWRVQSALSFKDDQGNEEVYKGEWSDVFSFTTGIKPPGLIAPANNAFDVPLTTKLEWDSFDGATGYHIQVSPDQSFASDYVIEDTLTTLTYDVPAGVLTNYTMYYWRMRVVLADNVAAWVSPWRFTTIMETPAQVYPECHQNDVDLQFTIVWSKVLGADKYRIQVATTPNFGQSDIVFTEEDMTNDRTKIENGLEANKTYYWRTQGYNDVNTGPWSTVCDFTTLALGVEDELAKELNFIAYPNPTSDKMNFEFTLKEASKVNLEIYDMSGLKVAELLNDNVGTGTHFINWNVKGISNGTYNLIMNVNGKTYIKLVGVSK